MRLLVIKPSSLGDVIHALPAVRILKRHFPDCHLSWLINCDLAPLAELFGDVDDILLFKRKEWGQLRGLPDFGRFLKQLHSDHFDLIFDFQGLFRSGVCAFAATGDRTIGFAHAREGAGLFYNERVSVPPKTAHAIDKNIYLVNHTIGTDYSYQAPNFAIQPAAIAKADDLCEQYNMDGSRPIVAIAPVSRWPSKTWPPTFFADVLCRVLDNQAVDLWLLGTATERTVGDEIVAKSPNRIIHNLMGETDLPSMVELLRRSRVLLTNDSGPMHIAAALGTTTVSLFGPTAPEKTGPYGQQHVKFQTGVPCAPCLRRHCPLVKQKCHDDIITADAVADAMLRIVDDGNRHRHVT